VTVCRSCFQPGLDPCLQYVSSRLPTLRFRPRQIGLGEGNGVYNGVTTVCQVDQAGPG
jgi:hypothetical protein